MSKPRTYISMMNAANKAAKEKVLEKKVKTVHEWVQYRDSALGALCMAEIMNHQELITNQI